MPRLDYRLVGGFFVDHANYPATPEAIMAGFKDIILAGSTEQFKYLRKVLGAGTDQFDKNLSELVKITDVPDLIKPFTS
jgi:hypothetical protein